jgi:methylated-DNA-[protein]-cysteine S-methyltransferase
MTGTGHRKPDIRPRDAAPAGARGVKRPRAAHAAGTAAFSAKLRTPFAVLGILTDRGALAEVRYLPLSERAQAPRDALARRVVADIERYLRDPTHRTDVPLAPKGTPFQRRVWDAISAIPVGESRTYGEIARLVRSAPRAVGQACGANPIALVVPCHRVVGSHGALGGFMGVGGPAGESPDDPIAIKRWLLAHEGYRFGRA